MSGFLTLVLALGALCLLLAVLVQHQCDDFSIFFYNLFCQIWLLPVRSLFFPNDRQKGSGSGGEER